VDRAYWAKEKRKWPVDLIGGQRHPAKKPRMTVESRQAILDTERIVRDDEPASNALEDITLEHYEDGFPKLPACLANVQRTHERPGTSCSKALGRKCRA
jgi:hypothetical protein